jgi:hypothetical protein
MKNNNINFNAGNFFTCLQSICFTSIKRGLLKPLAYFFGFKFVREIIHKSAEVILQPSDRNGILKRIGNWIRNHPWISGVVIITRVIVVSSFAYIIGINRKIVEVQSLIDNIPDLDDLTLEEFSEDSQIDDLTQKDFSIQLSDSTPVVGE